MLYFDFIVEFSKWFKDNSILGIFTVLGAIVIIIVLMRLLLNSNDGGKKTTVKTKNP